MKRLIPFLLFFSVLFASSAFADSDSSKCGLSQDGKSLDMEFRVCPQNIAQKIKFSFLGNAIFGQVNDSKGVVTKSTAIEDELSEGQKTINASNQEMFSTIVLLSYGIALSIACFLLYPMIVTMFKAVLAGEFHEKGNEPIRYRAYGLQSIGISVVALGGLMPGLFGVNNSLSSGAYALLSASNGSAEVESSIIGRFINDIITGNMEIQPENESLADYRAKKENSHTYYSAQATVSGLIATSLVISNTSAFNNTIDNLNKPSQDWKIRDATADVWQPNSDQDIIFEKRFSEDPNQIMWATDAVTFAKNPTDIGETLPYLKAINYNKSYRDFDDIDGLTNQAAKLMTDIETSSFYDNPAGFLEIKQSALSLFFKDAQANIMRKNFLPWMVKSDAIADLVINYACSKSVSSRMSAQLFIDAHSGKGNVSAGNASCVSNDWKIMGLGNSEQYASQIKEQSDALIQEYYNVRLKINTQFHNSMVNQKLLERMLEAYQKGFLHLVWVMPGIMDDANFAATAQNQFGTSSPMGTLQTQALGSYIVDDWAVAHGYGDSNDNDLNMGEIVRELNLIPNSDGTPSLSDSSAIMQKAYSTNATASAQQADFYQAVGVGLENPKIEMDACIKSSKYPVTCMQKYGQQISETMTQIMMLAATTKLISYAATSYGDKKKDRVIAEQVKAEEKAGVSKSAINKKKKAMKKSPNFMQVVGAITGGLSTIMFGWALKGYMLATAFKFLVISIMTGPFYLLYVLNIMYLMLLLVTMPFAILAFAKLNDLNNLKRIGATMLGILCSALVCGPLITFFYITNWELAGIFNRIITEHATNGLGAAIGQNFNIILQKMMEIFVTAIIFFIVNISCTNYALKALQETAHVMGIPMPYLQYGITFLSRIEAMCVAATGGMYFIVSKIIDRKTAKSVYNLFGKLGRKLRRNGK